MFTYKKWTKEEKKRKKKLQKKHENQTTQNYHFRIMLVTIMWQIVIWKQQKIWKK